MYNQKYHKFERLYNHKFGFHINGPSQAAYEAAIRLKPRIIKTLEYNLDAMQRLREAIPDAFFIGRLFEPVQDFGNQPEGESMAGRIQRARQRGREFAEKILRLEVNNVHYKGRPLFDAWESFNEIFPESVDADSQKIYDEFQVAFGQRLLAVGFEPIAMNFATGNFRGRQFIENFPGTLDMYKYLGFHEYDWPRLDRLHNLGLNAEASEKNIRDRLLGVGANRGNDGMWLCLRYRRIMYEGIRQKYGDQHVCIITECGMTQGVQQGEDVGPWYESNTLPRDYPDSALPSPIPAEVYWQQLLWYNSELMKDDYVMGACLFVTGATGQWASFEHVGPITDRLAAFQTELGLTETPADVVEADKATTEARPETVNKPLNAATSSTVSGVDESKFDQVEISEPTSEISTSSSPTPESNGTPVGPSTPQWTFNLTTGVGLPLLVGDIGLANESITLIRPNGAQEQLVSGSKPEYGVGGFEIYANEPGLYRVQFLDQDFTLSLEGRFTRVIFSQKTDPGSSQGSSEISATLDKEQSPDSAPPTATDTAGTTVKAAISFRDGRTTYAPGEKVFIRMEVSNTSSQPVTFSILGLLTNTGRFQTSWTDGVISPGAAFQHEDSLTFDTPGAYRVQLSICFSSKETCLSSDEGWQRFEPGLEMVVQPL